MATSRREADQAWGMLSELEEEERQAKMLEIYTELAALPEEGRVSRLVAMVVAEYALPRPKLHTFTKSRLAVWLTLEPEIAQRISASYDAAMGAFPGLQSTQWVTLANQLARERSEEEQARLVALLPSVFMGIQPRRRDTRKKTWWSFWR